MHGTIPIGIKDRTNQGFTNISSSKGSTIMFDLSKSFSQLCLAIYGENFFSFLRNKHLKWFEHEKKKINSLKSVPLFCRAKSNSIFSRRNMWPTA